MNADSKTQRSRQRSEVAEDVKVTRSRGQIPDSAEFCGYVVHVPETDDYLAHFVNTPGITRRAYARSPEHAIVYSARKIASKMAKRLPKPAVVGMLFDLGKQLYVEFEGADAQAN